LLPEAPYRVPPAFGVARPDHIVNCCKSCPLAPFTTTILYGRAAFDFAGLFLCESDMNIISVISRKGGAGKTTSR
jgi:Mrp family chromosome partitioning ATPase